MEEIWKDISGYEGLYQISNLGRVKSFPRNGTIKSERILNLFHTKDGYLFVCLRNKGRSYPKIHRLVAEAFLDNPYNKETVNHIDGNKENNNVNNLEWATRSEQEKWKYVLGYKSHLCRKVSCKETGELFQFQKRGD